MMHSPKPLSIELSFPARDDLTDIAQYTLLRYGELQMETYMQALYAGISRLSYLPHIGHSRDDLPEGYQSLEVEKHVLIFTRQGERLVIARILHQSRDIRRHV